ncbi:MAG: CDP-alcohol phosphatidyltransferase family protein [Acidobacteriia bacterium]|nr:CDP-alcohol phosphatidyltransferase family protein [Terriglobia bacterium]
METFRRALAKLLIPLGESLASFGVSPHLVSISGIVFGCLTAWCFVTGQYLLANIAFVLSGLSDAVDGIVARTRGLQSPFGSFFDNFCSLYTDSAAFAGLIVANLCSPFWGVAALVGTLARLLTFRLEGLLPKEEAEALRWRFPFALAGKGDRILLVALGTALGRIDVAIIVIAVATNLVAIYRSYYLYSGGMAKLRS